MNAIKMGTMVMLIAAVILIGLCVVAPIVVQDGANDAVGNGDTAVDNISESLDNLNEALEDASQVDEWLANLDEVNQ